MRRFFLSNKGYTVSTGFLTFVFHAHLPFVRHPKFEEFLEENWLFDALSDTYLPLLRVFSKLKEDEIPFRITFSISPTLAAMLGDKLLQNRYILHLEKLNDLAEKEVKRTEGDVLSRELAGMYKNRLQQNYVDFTEKYKKNVLRGFRDLQKSGNIELITCPATHPYLPLFSQYPESIEAQVQTAVMSHGRVFGSDSPGIWVPECGYFPGLERYFKINNLKYFFVAAHAVLFAENKPRFGVFAPIQCPNGVHAFGRDHVSSNAVWSPEEGYPGDYVYREFYRDIGFDLPIDYIGPYIHNGELRTQTGFKYYAITGKTGDKRPYNIAEAMNKVEEHAENFLYNRLKQINKLGELMDRPPIIVCPFDAELFGHWWYEGPMWLDLLFRKLNNVKDTIILATPADYLEHYPENQVSIPSFSSWGNKGYSEVWLNGSNDWIYRHIHKAIERMVELAKRFPDAKGLKERALNQAAREVLLSQASDWPFIIRTGTTIPYAVQRMKEHIHNFTAIYDNLCRNTVNTEWLTRIERKNNILPDIDYRLFSRQSSA